MKSILFLFFFSLEVHAGSPPYPHGTETVCIVLVDENFEHPEIVKTIAVDGFVQNLKIPEGKIVFGEVKCHE